MDRVNKMEKYSPSIKQVLRNFHATAERSLSGPTDKDSTLVLTGSVNSKRVTSNRRYADCVSACRGDDSNGRDTSELTEGVYLPRGSCDVRFQQVPILLAQDNSVSESSEDVLEGETISCFAIGGEMRLCVPEILRKVLNNFHLNEIHHVYEQIQIFTSLCSHAQLCTLKYQGKLPASAATCGLITHTNAERLCNALLRRYGEPCPGELFSGKTVRVIHRCFGKCAGIFHIGLYISPTSRCVKCCECGGMFAPSEFVCHAHHDLENRTCHWGFNSSNWRKYLMLPKKEKWSAASQKLLDDVKSLFVDINTCKRCLSGDYEADGIDGQSAITKKPCVDEGVWKEDVKGESWQDPEFVLHSENEISLNPGDISPSCSSRCVKVEISSDDETAGEDRDKECHVDSLAEKCKAAAAEESSLWDAELHLFNTTLEQAPGLSADAKQRVIGDYIRLQERHLLLAKCLIGIRRMLDKEVNHLVERVDHQLIAAAAEKQKKVRELEKMTKSNKAKLRDFEEENERLRAEIQAILKGSKRSNVGLMKAKYKAQMEHFRRKLLSVEQSHKVLGQKHSELHDILRNHLTSALPFTAVGGTNISDFNAQQSNS